MLLAKLVIKNYGPFSVDTELRFEPDVTVLTGANDTGKTSVLNLVGRLCQFKEKGTVGESEVNVNRFGELTASWETDAEFGCYALFHGTSFSGQHVSGQWGAGDELDAVFGLAPQAKSVKSLRFRKQGQDKWSSGGGVSINKFPLVIRLPCHDALRPVIDMAKPNTAETCFLRAAFGTAFSYENFSSVSDHQFAQFVSKARGDMNARIGSVLPPSMHLEFDFQLVKGERQHLSIHLRDQFSGHTSLGVRGAGIQRLASIIGGIFSHDLTSQHVIILFDEPENSLHADAQHTLRAILEGLGEKENIQVIYTTHSPSMINTVRPASIRVLRQTSKEGKATCEIVSRPIDDDYFTVRTSLGVTPADSLLFAPVTLIVEGPTEAIGMSVLMPRLEKADVEGFGDVSGVFGQCHIVDGSGDSFEYLCRVVKSHGAKPIVFLDGDKRGSRLDKIRKHHPDVPVILFPEQQEFEDIVPRETYFGALREVLREFHEFKEEELLPDAFNSWDTTAALPEQMMFTKKIGRWLQKEFGIMSFEKPSVMKRALLAVDPHVVQAEELRKMLCAMRRLLHG